MIPILSGTLRIGLRRVVKSRARVASTSRKTNNVSFSKWWIPFWLAEGSQKDTTHFRGSPIFEAVPSVLFFGLQDADRICDRFTCPADDVELLELEAHLSDFFRRSGSSTCGSTIWCLAGFLLRIAPVLESSDT